MSLHKSSGGTRVTLAAINDVTTEIDDSDPWVEIDEDLTERTEFSGGSDATAATGDDQTTLAFKAGQVVRKSAVLAKLTDATVDAITPATGAAAGGTVLAITGTGLDGATGVTFGGTAGTSFAVVNPRRVNVTTPAKTAGAYDVVVADDAGAVTKTNGFTYT